MYELYYEARIHEHQVCNKKKGKGKVHPKTGHQGPDGEYMYSPTLSLTLELDGVGA